jgi:hypothetical protein
LKTLEFCMKKSLKSLKSFITMKNLELTVDQNF